MREGHATDGDASRHRIRQKRHRTGWSTVGFVCRQPKALVAKVQRQLRGRVPCQAFTEDGAQDGAAGTISSLPSNDSLNGLESTPDSGHGAMVSSHMLSIDTLLARAYAVPCRCQPRARACKHTRHYPRALVASRHQMMPGANHSSPRGRPACFPLRPPPPASLLPPPLHVDTFRLQPHNNPSAGHRVLLRRASTNPMRLDCPVSAAPATQPIEQARR